jgi:hypothetical protein
MIINQCYNHLESWYIGWWHWENPTAYWGWIINTTGRKEGQTWVTFAKSCQKVAMSGVVYQTIPWLTEFENLTQKPIRAFLSQKIPWEFQ